jgi:hypothetical protein
MILSQALETLEAKANLAELQQLAQRYNLGRWLI